MDTLLLLSLNQSIFKIYLTSFLIKLTFFLLINKIKKTTTGKQAVKLKERNIGLSFSFNEEFLTAKESIDCIYLLTQLLHIWINYGSFNALFPEQMD